jgi:hypothetical protein
VLDHAQYFAPSPSDRELVPLRFLLPPHEFFDLCISVQIFDGVEKIEVVESIFCTDFSMNSTDFSMNSVDFFVNRVNFSEIGPELEDMRVMSISVYRLSSFKEFLLVPNHPLWSHSPILQYEDSKYYVKIETNSYQPLCRICVALMCMLPNIKIIGIDPNTFLL